MSKMSWRAISDNQITEADAEAIPEKVAVAQRAASSLLAGESIDNVVGNYRQVVRANARRLTNAA
ncbi:hypothetical protein ABEG18_00060 [Alsobacter sp. KACC 23698]|uniref:Uncharacterized protein n=1 Tax=Alsobacter sp. KACC 23698 TaxID=3149229 RepID=A0AAU7JFP8_9HYPH